MKYFKECKCIEDVKARFKELVKKLHPDNGGDAESFKEMMNEYKKVFETLKNIHKTQEGKTYQREPEPEEAAETPEEYADLIEKLLKMEGVHIEIIGSWIWLTGNTMMYKEAIKDLHFFWSKSKKAWYYTGQEKKSRRRGRYSMDGLRNHWGTQEVGTGTDSTAKIA